MISPSNRGGWTHSPNPVAAEDAPHRIELWHTRLGVRSDGRRRGHGRRAEEHAARRPRSLGSRPGGPRTLRGRRCSLPELATPQVAAERWTSPSEARSTRATATCSYARAPRPGSVGETGRSPRAGRRGRPVALRARRLARPARRMGHRSVLARQAADAVDPALGSRRAARPRPVRARRVPRLPLPLRAQDDPGEAHRAKDEGRRAVGGRAVPEEVPRRRPAAQGLLEAELPLPRGRRHPARHPHARGRSEPQRPLHPDRRGRAVPVRPPLRRQGAAVGRRSSPRSSGSPPATKTSPRSSPSTTRAASTRCPPNGQDIAYAEVGKGGDTVVATVELHFDGDPRAREVRAAAHGRFGRDPGGPASCPRSARSRSRTATSTSRTASAAARTSPRSGPSCPRRPSSRSARARRPGATRPAAFSSRTWRSPGSRASRGPSATTSRRSPRATSGLRSSYATPFPCCSVSFR